MTPVERDDLIEFLTGQFAQIDRQFVQVHQLFGQMDEPPGVRYYTGFTALTCAEALRDAGIRED